MNNEEIYYKLRLIREAEEAIIREYPTNDLKTPCHLAIGAESIPVAISAALDKRNTKFKVFGTYRNHHWYLACGGSIENFFLELYGKKNPIADGKAGSMHLNCPDEGLILTSAVVASQIGPAVGHAFAMKYKGDETLTICSLGDGATEEGVFYECLNLAVLHQLKILFVVEDNLLAIHQHKKDRQMFRLGKLVRAYNEIKPIEYYHGKAYSFTDAIRAVSQVERFPAVLHLFYHRFYEHVGINSDYQAGYRERPSNLKELDPLHRFERKITKTARCEIDERIKNEIESAIQKAKAAPLAPKEALLEHVFA